MKDEGRTERVVVLMTPDEVSAVDAWMFERQIRRGRSEAIRQLIARGLLLSDEDAAVAVVSRGMAKTGAPPTIAEIERTLRPPPVKGQGRRKR